MLLHFTLSRRNSLRAHPRQQGSYRRSAFCQVAHEPGACKTVNNRKVRFAGLVRPQDVGNEYGDLNDLKARGTEMIDQQTRIGLAGRICFLHPSAMDGALVELCQPLSDEVVHAVHAAAAMRGEHA